MSAQPNPPADPAPPEPDATASGDPTLAGRAETTGQRLHYNAFAHWLAQFAPARRPESSAAAPLPVEDGEPALAVRPS